MIARLTAARFRNLHAISIGLVPGFNLFVGANGSGKTSVLEAAYFLSSGRSFRDISADPLITRGEEDSLVTGQLVRGGAHYNLGIQRFRNGTREIHINGEKVHRASALARLLPVLVLWPGSVDLLLGSPSLRRRFLNWGLFHVEPGFADCWEEANRCLKQRNLLLRQGVTDRAGLKAWTDLLVEHADQLHAMRENYMTRFLPVFDQIAARLAGMAGISVEYFRGWERTADLAEVYEKDTEIDEKRGYTQRGFQRADVRITVDGQPASKVCSRGELKALTWSLILAQGALASDQQAPDDQYDTLYLVDDLASEFDGEHRQRVCQFLAETGQQVMLTGIDQDALLAASGGKADRMFHVKQGQIEQTG